MTLNVSSIKWESGVSLGKSFIFLEFQFSHLKETKSHLSCGWPGGSNRSKDPVPVTWMPSAKMLSSPTPGSFQVTPVSFSEGKRILIVSTAHFKRN